MVTIMPRLGNHSGLFGQPFSVFTVGQKAHNNLSHRYSIARRY
jgi:hypothetical protein